MYQVLGRGITNDLQLNKVGKSLFGKQWLGVFPVDVKPARFLANVQPGKLNYAIINVDGQSDPGSHWLSVIFDASNNKYYIYDSFARRLKRLIPKFVKTIGFNYITMNGGSDQKNSSMDCGARSMSVLLFVAKHGLTPAMMI